MKVARVGLSEAQARLKYDAAGSAANGGGDGDGGVVATVVRPLSKVDRALCDLDDPQGFIKIVFRKRDGAILGEERGGQAVMSYFLLFFIFFACSFPLC